MELAQVERVMDGVIIRMNRPEKRNAVNDALAAPVIAGLDAAEAAEAVRGIHPHRQRRLLQRRPGLR